MVGSGRWLKVGAAVGCVVAMIALWSLFGAPSAAVELKGAALVVFQAAWFAVGAAAIVALGRRVPALLFVVLYVINMVLVYHWHQQKG